MHLAGLIALGALAATPRAPQHAHFLAEREGRDSLLVSPAPYPSERTDDARRPERARVWVSRSPIGSRTPIDEQVGGAPGPAAYGGAPDANEERILVRVVHTPIAIDPFTEIRGRGSLRRLELARHAWLAEQGYVLHVRTHVNERPVSIAREPDASGASAAPPAAPQAAPRPRAILRIERDEPRKQPARMRV